MKNNYDVIIAGGGAAGLACACVLAGCNKKVLIIEKNAELGKKILRTGSGKCNLGNINIDSKFWHGSVLPKRMDIINEFGNGKEFFARLGMPTRTDFAGRIYPLSNKAETVRYVLTRKINSAENIDILYNTEIYAINGKKKNFVIKTKNGNILKTKYIVMATGGYAAPKTGSDGTSWKILRDAGINIKYAVPSLCPLNVKENIASLKGVRHHAKISLFADNNLIYSEKGEIQFNESCISGVCILNASGYLNNLDNINNILSVDFVPDLDKIALYDFIMHECKGMTPLETAKGMMFEEAANYITSDNTTVFKGDDGDGIPERRLVVALKNQRFTVCGRGKYNSAQVTAGGITGEEISLSLDLKKIPGLYVCGEICDVNGDCGGYNLLWAWASGAWVGRRLRNIHD